MIETKDVIQIAVGVAGWGLAAYQFWRNELLKRPLALMEVLAPHAGLADCFLVEITVRNRGPRDLYVHRALIKAPRDARFMEFLGPGRIIYADEEAIGVKLVAFSSGAFPFTSHHAAVSCPSSGTGTILEIAVEMSESLDATNSKRFIVRQSIQRTKM